MNLAADLSLAVSKAWLCLAPRKVDARHASSSPALEKLPTGLHSFDQHGVVRVLAHAAELWAWRQTPNRRDAVFYLQHPVVLPRRSPQIWSGITCGEGAAVIVGRDSPPGGGVNRDAQQR